MGHRRLRTKSCAAGAVWLVVCSLSCIALSVSADDGAYADRRAKPPKFDPGRVSSTFFDDVFSKLQGERPSRVAGESGGAAAASDSGSGQAAENMGSGVAWDELISATSIEDEIKSLRIALNESVTTPSQFRSRGHKPARRQFVLLNMLFWVMEHYRGDVRWKSNAKAIRQLLGKTAGGAKAGGNEQAYAQARRAKDVLDQLIRGERAGVEPLEEDEVVWEAVAPRRPLMRLLEDRFEANLKAWTSNESEFKSNSEELLREAELVAAIGQFFIEDGMDDADDEEYAAFSEAMKGAAQQVVNAVKQGDLAAAQKGVGQMSQSCANCHDDYR